MIKPLEWVKDHPVIAGVGLFAVGLVLVLALSGGSSVESSQPVLVSTGGTDTSAAAAASALAQSSLQAGVANQATSAQLQTNLAGISADLQMSQIKAASTDLGLNLSAQVSQAQIAAQAKSQDLVSSLSSAVAMNQAETQKFIAANNNSTQVQVAGISAAMQTTMQGFLAQMQASADQKEINLAKIYSDTTISTTNTQAGVLNNQVNAARDVQNAMINAQTVQAGYRSSEEYARIIADRDKDITIAGYASSNAFERAKFNASLGMPT